MSTIKKTLTDYVPQDVRTLNIRVALLPGYPTSRWSAKLPFVPYSLADCKAQIRNLGSEVTVMRFQETDDESDSGARSNLGSAVCLQPGGTASVSFTPSKQFMEVKGIYGHGPVWAEVQTKIDWNDNGFSKLDGSYPATEYAADVSAVTLVNSAAQTFTSNTTWAVTHNLGVVASKALFNSAGVDITSLATISNDTATGYTATFSVAQAGTAYSSK